jgi:hypothetical protein
MSTPQTQNKKSVRTFTNWHKSEISLSNYQRYLDRKVNRFELSLVDLLYISNFKGGNATINVKEEELNIRLKHYSEILEEINRHFGKKSLIQLTLAETERLIIYLMDMIRLTLNHDTNIDGFKSSYLSALLHSFFPRLIPILDRRLLINMKLVSGTDLLSTKQVRNIASFYAGLIRKTRELLMESDKTLRELDREYFTIDLPAWAK